MQDENAPTDNSAGRSGDKPLSTKTASANPVDVASLPNKFAGLSKEQIVSAISDMLKRDPALSMEPRIRQAIAVQVSKSHSGPLPAPEDFAEYERHCPGGADRILRMAESAQQHQFNIDKEGLSKSFLEARIGQIFGFVLGLSGIIGGVVCILQNHAIGGTILSGASLVALVTVFVKGRNGGNENSK